jgi:hypothetical protein
MREEAARNRGLRFMERLLYPTRSIVTGLQLV